MLLVRGCFMERCLRMRRAWFCMLCSQLLYSMRCICPFEDLLYTRCAVSSEYALCSSQYVHTCESGSMAASDGLFSSLPSPFCASFECAVGEVGLRTCTASLPLVTTGLRISIDAVEGHGKFLALTLSFVGVFSCVASALRTNSAEVWVCCFEFGQ